MQCIKTNASLSFLDNIQLIICKINQRIYVGEFTNVSKKVELGGEKSLFIISSKVLSVLNYMQNYEKKRMFYSAVKIIWDQEL